MKQQLVREMVGGEWYEYRPLGKFVVSAPGVCRGRPTFKYTRIEVAGVPEHVRLAPRTIVEAQFSMPYTVAAAWIDGGLGLRHFIRRRPAACRHSRSRRAGAAVCRCGDRS